ncbi:MAG: peptidylprolyl isomerase [Clostridia bacterium]|nr:peptidylprolyl isomerase [Clostridia bacterium]
MKKIIALSLVLLFSVLLFSSCGKQHTVEITVENYGVITLVLDETVAPITVKNFLKLVKEGFYDGLTFHRIMDGFMIQGGDPKGNGTGGSSEKIKGEFSANGVENNLSHTRGVISMARSSSMNSASSQFFIVHQDSTFLDGQYAAFGWVTSGMEVVDAICKSTPVTDNNGTVLPVNQPKITAFALLVKIKNKK